MDPRPRKAKPAENTTQQAVERADKFAADAIDDGVSPLARLFGSRKRPHRFVTFPGYDEADPNARVAVVALSVHELLEARLAAFDFITKVKKLEDWLLATEEGQAILNNEIQTQVLFRGMRRADNIEVTYAATANEVRLYFEPSTATFFFNAWLSFQEERSPVKALDDAGVEEVVSALGKGQLPHVALSYYDSSSLRNIIVSLADRLAKLMRQPSSDT